MSAVLKTASGAVIGNLPLTVEANDGRVLLEIKEGALEGGLRIIAPAADYEAHRNNQGGFLGWDGHPVSKGTDVSSGGGTPETRMPYVVNRDNGSGFFVGRGRPTRHWAMEVRTFEDGTKDWVGFLNTPVKVRHLLVPDGRGGWRKAAV
jgi:hypothetical protein